MNRISIAAALLLLSLHSLTSADIFIVSDPMNSRIFLDNQPLLKTTPCFIRDIEQGEHRIEIRKEGYITEIREINIADDDITIIRETLATPFFTAIFREESKILFDENIIAVDGFSINLPEGIYQFERDEHLAVNTRFPAETLLKGVTAAFFTSVIYSGFITADSIIENPKNFEINSLMATSWAATAILGLADLKLIAERRRFNNKLEESYREINPVTPTARELYNRAEAHLSEGKIDNASLEFTRVVTDHPESIYSPMALYKISKINIVNGNISLAVAGLELLLDQYPLPELYDKTCHTLAGLYSRENNQAKSLEYLDLMLFIDPLYSREEIETYRQDIISRNSEDESGREE